MPGRGRRHRAPRLSSAKLRGIVNTPSTLSASVVLCTYNGERWLPELWRSLLAQTRVPDEVVVRDDASTDQTFALLGNLREAAQARGIRVTLARNERNLGFVGNFEAALAEATGQIVFLCDQDDIWHPQKIALMLAEFERRPDLVLLHSDARLVDEAGADMRCGLFEALEITGRERTLIHSGRAFDALLRRNLATGAALAFRRSLLREVAPFPPEWVHDEWLAIIAAALGEVDCLEQPLIDYRQHGGNQIGAQWRGVGNAVMRVNQPRTPYLSSLIVRTEILLARAQGLAARFPEARRRALQDKLAHLRRRTGMPACRPCRVPAVLLEGARGGYARYARGIRALAYDLFGRN